MSTAADVVHVGCKRLRDLLAQPELDREAAAFVIDHMESRFAGLSRGQPPAPAEPAPEPRIVVTASTRWA